jgi:hypothetical protein
MPRKPSLHAVLDQLRQQAAGERVKQRDLEARLEVAKAKVDEASQAVTNAYAMESERDIASSRDAEAAAVAAIEDLEHQVVGAELRVQRADAQATEYERAHAKGLLEERAATGRELAADLTRAAQETVRLHRAYGTERAAVDRLILAAGGQPRHDSCEPEHAWERELRDLDRAVRTRPEVSPPEPRWFGIRHREAENEKSRGRRLRRQRSAGIL